MKRVNNSVVKFSVIFWLSTICTVSAFVPRVRIIDGKQAFNDQFPYTASLSKIISTTELKHSCGGAIVSERFILTAAHCIHPNETKDFVIFTGSVFRYQGDEHEIKAVHHHEHFELTYVNGQFDRSINDIALIEVETPIQFSHHASPIKIGRVNIGPNVEAVATGWGGAENPKNVDLNHLNYLEVKTIDNPNCGRLLQLFEMEKTFLCTLSHKNVGQMCAGDSGGALVANNELIGILSFTPKVCASGPPDAYTRVSEFADWIEYTIALSMSSS